MTDQLDRLKAALADRYAIERELGQGGMATVYLAEDLKHKRKVAVKVLRPDLAAALGPDRFLREIEVAARLQHPHILPLHDSGEADGFLYYIMPYVEGESLRAKLAREGELPIADAVRILRDVVDALTDAHEHGVVHRDIKPDNVLLTKHHAVVTDFGVAKAVSDATGRQALTTAGVALGTPAYMAPEQAVADPHVDHRADIYAVGAVAYELLTGRAPFAGHTAQAILSAHVTEAVEPVTKHRASVPPGLAQLVMKCLEKKPADRWQSAEEMLPHLEALATPSGGVTPMSTAPVTAVRPRSSVRPAVVTGVMVAIAVLGFLGWFSLRGGGPVVTITSTRQLTRAPALELQPAISPDGSQVAYAAGTGFDSHLYIQDLGGGRAFPLTSDRPGSQFAPQWTPDGARVAFVEFTLETQIPATYLMPRLGGPASPVAVGPGMVWGIHGDRVAYVVGDSIMVRPIEDGVPTLVTQGVDQPHSVSWSPDGAMLAYVQGNLAFVAVQLGNIAPSSIWLVRVEGGDPVPVTEHPSLNVSPVWFPGGRHVLFVSDRDGPRDLYVVRVDESGARGEPVRITTGLDAHSVSLSADGATAAYSRFTLRRNVMAVDIPRTGSVSVTEARPVTVGNQIVENSAVSRDGQLLAFDTDIDGNQNIYVVPAEGGEPRRVTTDPGDDFYPSFSPDGNEIVFHSTRYGSRDIFLAATDGSNEVRLTDDPGDEMAPAFSPDGLAITFQGGDGPLVSVGLGAEVWVMTRDAVGGEWSVPRQLTREGGGGNQPAWSPDGSSIVFSAGENTGGESLNIVSLDGEERTLLDGPSVGLAFVRAPGWPRDSRDVYFLGVDMTGLPGVYAVPAEGGRPRLVVRLDDPTKQDVFGISFGNGKAYLSVTETDSDIYVMDLEIR